EGFSVQSDFLNAKSRDFFGAAELARLWRAQTVLAPKTSSGFGYPKKSRNLAKNRNSLQTLPPLFLCPSGNVLTYDLCYLTLPSAIFKKNIERFGR
ncbi:MAG: hypothetical protein ABIA77_06835, partial [Candidatus Omnitrophota bacterium]